MEIYRAEAGDTPASVAARYGIGTQRLAEENGISPDASLVPGQALVIVIPEQVYTVREGDTLFSVAAAYGVTTESLQRNNPALRGGDTLYPGQTLVISYVDDKLGTVSVNGYAYPNIDPAVLAQTLPYLTYLTIFSYGITRDGRLLPPDDGALIAAARAAGVAPLLLLSTLGEDGRFNNALSSLILNNTDIQEALIDELIRTVQEKEYYGVDVDFEFVLPEERELYVQFLMRMTGRMNGEGIPVMAALAPKTSADQPGLLYEAHDYAGIGAAVNAVLLMTYEWGYTYGPPMAVAPLRNVREVIAFGVRQIPSEKIFMGIPNYGYDWTLPFVAGESRARSLGNVQAVELAAEYGASIRWDPTAQTPFFYYTGTDGAEHVVWFEDAESIDAKLGLITEYALRGCSVWNLMRWFPQLWTVLNARCDIRRQDLSGGRLQL